jgi:hypothetical protein
MKYFKKIISKLPLISLGILCVFITAIGTDTEQVLYFPLDTYEASNCDYYCYTNHHGVDFAEPEGTPVYAPISGTIIASRDTITGPDCERDASGYYSMGNYIRIQDDTGDYVVTLMHLQSGTVEIYDGTVEAGDLVGYVSNTGFTKTTERSGEDLDGDGVYGDGDLACGDLPSPQRGYHLHVGLQVNGNYADPTDYWIRDRSDVPIKAETAVATTCPVPDATTTFYIESVGTTYYATNNTPDPDATWSGVLEGEATISGSNVTFAVSKSDGSTFFSSGTMYLKVGSYESYAANRGEPADVTVGISGVSFAVDDQITHEWCTYTKDYYMRYEADDGGYTVVGPFTIEEMPALGRVANPDADYDDLDDDDETSLGTDMNNPDTDGDGLSDGFEVEEGLDPLVDEGKLYWDTEDAGSTAEGDECSVPASGDWTITSDCNISSAETAPANVRVEDGVTLTIGGSGSLNINLTNYHIIIGDGSRLIIEDGGKIY